MTKSRITTLVIIVIVIAAAVIGNYYLMKPAQEKANEQEQQQTGEQNNQNQEQEQNQDADQVTGTVSNGDNSQFKQWPDEPKAVVEAVSPIVAKANAGKLQEALTDYLALEKTYPTSILLLNNIADLYSDMSNWTKSAEYYKKLIAAHPDYTPAYRMLGYLYEYHMGNKEVDIKALFDAGLKVTNNSSDLAGWMAAYYEEQGSPAKAAPYAAIVAANANKNK